MLKSPPKTVKSPPKHGMRQLLWPKLSSNLSGVGKLGVMVGLELKCPIFIVGTGRCGTDLLIDALKFHPELVGFPGEANELWHPKLYPCEEAEIENPPIEVDPRKFTEVSIKSWPPHHSDKIRRTFEGFHFISGYNKLLLVKSAMISFMIPKIVEIFPDARFIHIYRFGPAVVESYVKKNFGTYSRYVFTEDEYRLYCARYWNSCILEIEKTKKSLSLQQRNAFFELSYEELCSNPESMLNSLARYVGVKEGAFDFDVSSINNRNKARSYTTDRRWDEPLRMMEPAMRLKGYIS